MRRDKKLLLLGCLSMAFSIGFALWLTIPPGGQPAPAEEPVQENNPQNGAFPTFKEKDGTIVSLEGKGYKVVIDEPAPTVNNAPIDLRPAAGGFTPVELDENEAGAKGILGMWDMVSAAKCPWSEADYTPRVGDIISMRVRKGEAELDYDLRVKGFNRGLDEKRKAWGLILEVGAGDADFQPMPGGNAILTCNRGSIVLVMWEPDGVEDRRVYILANSPEHKDSYTLTELDPVKRDTPHIDFLPTLGQPQDSSGNPQ